MSWKKGAIAQDKHVWIGLQFHTEGGNAITTVTHQCKATLAEALTPLSVGKATSPLARHEKRLAKPKGWPT